jgi:hypothetical protein
MSYSASINFKTVNKVGSVARRFKFEDDTEIREGYAKRGDFVIFVVEREGSLIDELELTSGRITKPRPGDVVLGAVGMRRASLKLVASMPPEGLKVKEGTKLSLINRSGLIGIVEDTCVDGSLTEVRCIGLIATKGKVANTRDYRLNFPAIIDQLPPLIVVVGTNMEVGKTTIAHNLIRELSRRNIRVCAAKLTGTASLRDILMMKDAGALEVADFLDGGLVTTADKDETQEAAGIVLNYLCSYKPETIVVELGGGLLTSPSFILNYQELVPYFSVIVMAASDLTSAFGGAYIIREKYGLWVDAIGGPVANCRYFRSLTETITKTKTYDFRRQEETAAFINHILPRIKNRI